MKKYLASKLFAFVLVSALLLSCQHDAESIESTTNKDGLKLELLFEKDGCKMYRFRDGSRSVYWADCPGNVTEIHTEGSGKSHHEVRTQSITSVTQDTLR